MSDRGRSPSSTGNPGGSPSRLNPTRSRPETKTKAKKGPPPRHVHPLIDHEAETAVQKSPRSRRSARDAKKHQGKPGTVGVSLTRAQAQQQHGATGVGVAVACEVEAASLFIEPKDSFNTDTNCNKMNESRTSQISDSGVESMESEKLRSKVTDDDQNDKTGVSASGSAETQDEGSDKDAVVDLGESSAAPQSIMYDQSNDETSEDSTPPQCVGLGDEVSSQNEADDGDSQIDESLEAKFDLLPSANGRDFLGVLGYRRIDLLEDEKDVMASSIICTDGSDVEALSEVDDNDNGLDGNENEKDSSDSIEVLDGESKDMLKYTGSADPLCPSSDTEGSNLETLTKDFECDDGSPSQGDPGDQCGDQDGDQCGGQSDPVPLPFNVVAEVTKMEAGMSGLKPTSSQVSENDSDSHDDSDTSDGGTGIGEGYLNYEDVMSSLIYGYTAMTDSVIDPFMGGAIHRPDSLCLPRPMHRRLARSESNSSSVHSYSSTEALIEAATSTPLHAQGTIDQEGDMIAFVAQDLAEKIRMSSPLTRSSRDSSYAGGSQTPSGRSVSSVNSMSSSTSGWSTSSASGWSAISPSGMSRSPSLLTQSPEDIPPIDPRVILDLENQARRVADNLDHMMRNLKISIHKMSALTANCVGTYRCAIDNTCDSVDGAIKSMYAMMAKCEELSKTMKPIYHLADQVKEIKRLLDLFEVQISREDK